MAHARRLLWAALAHELNQPLAAILANAQAALRLLEREPVKPQQIEEIVTDIVAQVRRANGVVYSMGRLFIKMQSSLQSVDVNALVRDVIASALPGMMERDVDLSASYCEGEARVVADGEQLQGVLRNLLANACEAVRSRDVTRGKVVVEVGSEANCVRLSISDNGPGIEPEARKRVFEAFVSTRGEGRGLGLFIADRVVRQHGGRIEVGRGPEGGACFTVVLPRAIV